MDINKCPNCQKSFDQDKRLSKQLPCGCIACLKCLKNIYQFTQKIECTKHQQVYNINPEELKGYNAQEPILQDLLQPQEQFADQGQIAQQFRCLQDQYVQKQNHYNLIREVIQANACFMKNIQSVFIQTILKVLIDQFSLSNVRIENLLHRLSDFQVANEIYQQQQALILGQQDPQLSQNPYSQLQYQFQQLWFEIEELKKDQGMDVQSLRVNVQRCMFNLFVYLSENSKDQLLSDSKAELLVQKYFKQFKVIRGLSQVSSSVVHQQGQFLSQSIYQQLIQESQNSNYQQQNQIIDKQQGQDLVQIKQFLVQKEISEQEKQVIDARLIFQQMEQKLLNISNDISFNNQVNQFCCEQKSLDIQPIPPEIITFEKLEQFFSQIKNENVSIQSLHLSPLNKSGLIEYPQILYQLPQGTDQQICTKLFQIIQLSKNQPQIQQVAVNALTLLNYQDFQFTNQDFQNLNLSNSDLSDTTFTSCNFANSNLTSANLRNSKFINCDFTNSNLTSIITEYPHIFTGHTDRVSSISISSDSEFIVSGSYDCTIILWDVKTGTCKTMSGHI